MQSLSVSDLQVFEIEESDVYSNKKKKKFRGKKFNFSKLKKLIRYDSGYGSTTNVDSNSVFFIDNFDALKRDFRSQSSKSLYDSILFDKSNIFGVTFSNAINFSAKKYKLNPRRVESNGKAIEAIKYESRSWDDIVSLSELVLHIWEKGSQSKRKTAINGALRNSYDYVQPNLNAKNCLFLNGNLLLQPLRRYTSEINLHKMHISREMFCDDMQLDSVYIDGNLVGRVGGGRRPNGEKRHSTAFKNVSEDIFQLVLDLHEFAVNEENVKKVSERINDIDKYLISKVKLSEIASYLFGKHTCGCKLTSICSVFGFSQAVNQIICDVIVSKGSFSDRVNYIIVFIQVAIHLYQMANWQSLTTVLNSLHSFNIYKLNNEWLHIQRENKTIFEAFVKLTAIMKSSESSVLISHPKGISNMRGMLLAYKIDCCAKWDRLENPIKWPQQPGIVDWLERELKHLSYTFEKNFSQVDNDFDGNQITRICAISLNDLPDNWTKRSVKNMPHTYQIEVVNYLYACLKWTAS